MLVKSTKSIGKGLIKGTKKVLTVEHWKEMATGALQLGLLFVKLVNQHDEFDQASFGALLSADKHVFSYGEHQYALNVKKQVHFIKQSLQKTYHKFKDIPWDELLEHGAEFGALCMLDIAAFHALNGLFSRGSQTIIEGVKNFLEKGTAAASEGCMIEVAGFGKLVIEEGIEVATCVSATIKNEPLCLNTFTNKTDFHKIKKQIKASLYGTTEKECIASENFINLATSERTNHILYGDKTGGGHLWPGKADKSIFPSSWNAEKVMHYVSDLATDPTLKPIWTRGAEGSLFTKVGVPSRYYIEGIREGIKIRVVIEPVSGKIITAFPIN